MNWRALVFRGRAAHYWGICFSISACLASAAAVDVSKLPAPLTRTVDFTRDIQPIFEMACLRCHGAERPKGRFSLVSREAALKGGMEGVDIVPGDSARSPLIHYVARLVPEMEMPPEGEGEPLTREQVALLRAWIDQGAPWPAPDPEAIYAQYAPKFSFTPAVRYVTVSGNERKFQEHQWVRRGFSAGVSDFNIEQKRHDGVRVIARGHALTDDYRVTLELSKEDRGFARAGFQQFRHYYDNSGPYFPFRASGFATATPNLFSLDHDTHLDISHFFVEFGVNLPDWPRAVIGYELHSRHGSESTLQWGPVTQDADTTVHIFPAWQEVNEDAHVLRLDVAYEVAGIHLENNMRGEFFDLENERVNATEFPAGAAYPSSFAVMRETHDQVQFANALHGEKSIREWLLVSAGYLFSDFNADATFDQDSLNGAGRPVAGTFWMANDIVLDESAHVFNVNSLLWPWDGLTLAVGILNEWSERDGFGRPNYREGDPNDPTIGVQDSPGLVASDTDRLVFEENVELRYTKIPATVLSAEVSLKQERVGLFEEQQGGEHDFLRDTDTHTDWQNYRAGFDVSPVRWAALHAAYRYRLHESDFDHDRDIEAPGDPDEGYPAFIRRRDSESDVIETRLALRATSWMRIKFSYELAYTDFHTTTDPLTTIVISTPGGEIFAGENDSATYSANVTLTPHRRWFLSTTFSYRETRTWTEDHENRSVAPYRGDIYSVVTSSTFALSDRTGLNASYSFSRARFGQNNAPQAVPLGIDYDLHSVQFGIAHRLSTRASTGLQYGFYRYDEPTAHGFNDYTAHVLFGTVAIAWP